MKTRALAAPAPVGALTIASCGADRDSCLSTDECLDAEEDLDALDALEAKGSDSPLSDVFTTTTPAGGLTTALPASDMTTDVLVDGFVGAH